MYWNSEKFIPKAKICIKKQENFTDEMKIWCNRNVVSQKYFENKIDGFCKEKRLNKFGNRKESCNQNHKETAGMSCALNEEGRLERIETHRTYQTQKRRWKASDIYPEWFIFLLRCWQFLNEVIFTSHQVNLFSIRKIHFKQLIISLAIQISVSIILVSGHLSVCVVVIGNLCSVYGSRLLSYCLPYLGEITHIC